MIAFRKQLFNSENCTNESKVEVLYEPFSADRILIKLEEWKYCFAYKVIEDSTMTPEEVKEYHEKIQFLKHNYKQHKKRKIQRRIIVADNNNCS